MTNPNNAVGTNAAYSGRTSPNAFNDVISGFTKGILSGWACSPKTGMTVQLGGVTGTRDVALVEDNNGNKLTINNRSGAPVEVTLTGAPVANNRIDCIVAYVDNPATGDGSTTDNPSTCGIIAVSGTVAANPDAPDDAAIRAAITTDGATGGVAYYVVLATILVGTNVTTIGSGVITQGNASQSLAAIADGSVTTPKLANGSVTTDKLDWPAFVPSTVSTCTIGKSSHIGTVSAASRVKCAVNADKTLFKIYGYINAALDGGAYTHTFTIGNTGLGPIPTAYTIADAVYLTQNDGAGNIQVASLQIQTDGTIKISFDSESGAFTRTRVWLPPALYFNVDFGD